MQYILYPPVFIVEPDTKFSDAWERFCCGLLNAENKTKMIRKRTPPDYGVDLIWEERKRAYQCKCSESGTAGSLNIKDIDDSIETAVQHQSTLGWKELCLCTNVDFTGTQEKRIKEKLPDIGLLTKEYWLQLCESHKQIASRRFRILVSISTPKICRCIDEIYLESYSKQMKEQLASDTILLFVYSNKRDEIFQIPFSSEFTAEDAIDILERLFKLPHPARYNDLKTSVSLSYSIVINDRKVDLNKTLAELNIKNGDIITFWKTIIWGDEEGRSKEHTMEFITRGDAMMKTKQYRPNETIRRYEKEIEQAFDKFLKSPDQNL